jgi:hypothetical protein
VPLLLAITALAFFLPVPLCDTAVDVHNLHVFVPVKSQGGQTLSFLLDSGAAAPLNIMDSSRAASLGMEVISGGRTQAIGGEAKIRFTDPVELSIGKLKLPKQKLALMDLAGAQTEEGHAVDGMLGYSLFQQFGVEIDYPARRLRLYDKKTHEFGPRLAAIPLRIQKKNCVITARLTLRAAETPVLARLIVDTGYDGNIMLTTSFARKHRLRAQKTNTGAGLGGTTSSGAVSLAAVNLGGLRIGRLNARASSDSKGAFSSSEIDGYVGGGVLKSYVVTFDYAHGRLLLARPRSRK